MLISVTLLSSYLYCPRKLYIEQVLRIVPQIKSEVALGIIHHNAYDAINKLEKGIVKSVKAPLGQNELEHIFRQKYSAVLRGAIINNKNLIIRLNLNQTDIFKENWPIFLEEAQFRSENLFKFLEKNKIFGEELWEKFTPKIESEVKIQSENLKLKGIIDQLEVFSETMIPLERKTGKAPTQGVWPGHKIQIAAYIMLLEEKHKMPIKKGIIRYTKTDREITMNPFLKDEVIKLRDEVIALLGSKEIPPLCQNHQKCSSCALKEQCFYPEILEKLIPASSNK